MAHQAAMIACFGLMILQGTATEDSSTRIPTSFLSVVNLCVLNVPRKPYKVLVWVSPSHLSIVHTEQFANASAGGSLAARDLVEGTFRSAPQAISQKNSYAPTTSISGKLRLLSYAYLRCLALVSRHYQTGRAPDAFVSKPHFTKRTVINLQIQVPLLKDYRCGLRLRLHQRQTLHPLAHSVNMLLETEDIQATLREQFKVKSIEMPFITRLHLLVPTGIRGLSEAAQYFIRV